MKLKDFVAGNLILKVYYWATGQPDTTSSCAEMYDSVKTGLIAMLSPIKSYKILRGKSR